MTLKLQLVRDGKVVFEIPLSPTGWSKGIIENELRTIDEDFQRFSKIFDALSHESRLRMMKQLIEEDDRTLSFADFMRDLDLNPKLVWENSRKLKEAGLLRKSGRGSYSCSILGENAFMMMSLMLRRLIESSEQIEE